MNKKEQQLNKRRRGQTMVEFALTLPLTLLLTFGVVEFGRLFQAWVTLQNSARAAVRYGVTGNWEPEDIETFTDPAKDGNPTGWQGFEIDDYAEPELILDAWIPCFDNRDLIDPVTGENLGIPEDRNVNGQNPFMDHWGMNCNPRLPDHLGLREDMARLVSIAMQAEIGATGLNIDPDYNMVGHGGFRERDSFPDNANWFHVFICSSRPPVIDVTLPERTGSNGRYRVATERADRLCEVMEDNHNGAMPWYTGTGPELGDNQYDAGGPGDFLEVVVHYNAEMITPIASLAGLTQLVRNDTTGDEFVYMMARRTGLNEAFRNTRAVNLPPQLDLLTATPSNTPVPTSTLAPTATETATPSESPSPTFTGTNTATPTNSPECSRLSIGAGDVRLNGPWLMVSVNNGNPGPVFLTGVNIFWTQHVSGQMYTAEARIIGRTSHWIAPGAVGDSRDYRVSPLNIDETVASWVSGNETLVRFDGTGSLANPPTDNQVTTWQLRFSNGPVDLNAAGYTPNNFANSYLVVKWPTPTGGITTCQIPFPGNLTPPPPPPNPTNTPTPNCSHFQVAFDRFDAGGVVVFTLSNVGPQPARIIGFDVRWLSGLWRDDANNPVSPVVDRIEIGPYQFGDPANVLMWDGNDTDSPTAFNQGQTGWITTPVIDRGMVLQMFVDFDNLGGPGRLDTYGAHASDFNGTRVFFEGCNIGSGDVPPPVATGTRPPTNTLAPTNTPTRTRTPTPVGPTHTFTPTQPTNTPTNTHTPTRTFTPRPPTSTNTPQSGCGWDGTGC